MKLSKRSKKQLLQRIQSNDMYKLSKKHFDLYIALFKQGKINENTLTPSIIVNEVINKFPDFCERYKFEKAKDACYFCAIQKLEKFDKNVVNLIHLNQKLETKAVVLKELKWWDKKYPSNN